MKKKVISLLLLFIASASLFGQGYNHNFLIGDDIIAFPPWTSYAKGIIKIDAFNFNIFGLSRKMIFNDSQSNIANDTGAVLFYTNGCWIANALEDTMLNGSGLNPDPYVTQVCTPPSALPYPQANIILPFPGDTNKYVLFHHGGSLTDPNSLPLVCYYSIIDMTLDGGLGGVVPGQKNVSLITDQLNIGFTACRHANGRDWWVYILKGNSNLIYTILLTDQGVQTPFTQSLGVANVDRGTIQPVFSPNGLKFAYRYATGGIGNLAINQVRIFDFDRCNGTFSNPHIVAWTSLYPSPGCSFSSNSKYLYTVSDFDTILQINTDTSNMQASMTVVAINDGYYSPFPPQQSSFWTTYLAANGKILISSGGGVVDLHYINYPDSGGLACDVHLHDLHMPCFTGRSNVNHPNYYLGCDTTQTACPCLTSISDLSPPDFKFRVYPNPVTNGFVNIGYLLPQNKHGLFEIYDVTGKVVFKYTLPPWSNEQSFKLPELANGVYNCVIRSDGKRVSKKVAVIRE